MTINDRVRMVRNELHMNQTEFGERLDVAQTYLTNIETGKRSLTEKLTKLICYEFNVSEQWLRTGEGEMFARSDASEIDNLVSRYHLRPLEKTVLETFVKLPEGYRDGVLEYIKSIVAAVVKEDGDEYRDIVDQQAEHENQTLRDNPAFTLPDEASPDDKKEARA